MHLDKTHPCIERLAGSVSPFQEPGHHGRHRVTGKALAVSYMIKAELSMVLDLMLKTEQKGLVATGP